MALRLCFLILVARQLRAATDRCADDADCDSEEAQLLQVTAPHPARS